MSESDDILAAARAAYEAATKALRLAEIAAGQQSDGESPPVIEELRVKRIAVVEDDGVLRMVIGNSTMSRLLPVRGRVLQHPGRDEGAGILFVNDEGTECGGLMYAGRSGDNGIEQGVFWSADAYEQNDSFSMGLDQSGHTAVKFLEFQDRPAWSLMDAIEEVQGLNDEETAEVFARHAGAAGMGASRLRLSRESDASVRLVLRDGQGRDRLRFVVPAEGTPIVEVVDEEGDARSILPE